MKSLATLAAVAALSLGFAGTASATAPQAQFVFEQSKDKGVGEAACYYKYYWFGNYYTRELICY